MKKHILSALVENKSGVLAHIAGLFSARGFNIDSLAVGETEDPAFSRMTIVVAGDEAILEQVRKQLEKLINVVKVTDFSGMAMVERDLLLVRVQCEGGRRGEVMELVHVFRARIVDVGPEDVMIEVSGPEQKVEALLELLRPFGVKEIVRTGRIALPRASCRTA